jgi:DNA-binding NarL/FixJ family response regulator
LTGVTRPLRVLIADDHEPTRAELGRALAADPAFEVCALVADAPRAVAAAVAERPDICLLDVRMPGGGVAAAWEIGARRPAAKIVMFTVSDDDADLFAALRAGADGYLLKTMNLRQLPDVLDGIFSGEAAMSRALVARVIEHFHGREPRWRQRVADDSFGGRLTSREWEVLGLLAQGHSTSAIARRLVLSSSAVRAHIAAIVRKLGVSDRGAAIELFRQRSED